VRQRRKYKKCCGDPRAVGPLRATTGVGVQRSTTTSMRSRSTTRTGRQCSGRVRQPRRRAAAGARRAVRRHRHCGSCSITRQRRPPVVDRFLAGAQVTAASARSSRTAPVVDALYEVSDVSRSLADLADDRGRHGDASTSARRRGRSAPRHLAARIGRTAIGRPEMKPACPPAPQSRSAARARPIASAPVPRRAPRRSDRVLQTSRRCSSSVGRQMLG